MIKAALTVIQILLVSFALASESGQFIYFTDIDGLPRNLTTCLEQDKYGYLWVGTSNGIARYDGKTFSSFDQMKEKIINSLYVDTKNNLWVGTNRGLYFYNRITNFFEFKMEGYTHSIQENQHEIYFIANTRILKITEKGLIEPISNVYTDHFCVTGDGIWYSDKNEGVKLKSRKSGFRETTEQQLIGKTIWVLREIGKNLFIGCSNGELFVRSAANGKLRKIPVENQYGYVEITKVRDEIWMATDGNGIVVLNAGLNYFRTIVHNPNRTGSISSNSIYDILPGHNGEIWIASYGAGLTCILPDNLLFKNIISEKGNSNSLIANEGIGLHIKGDTFYFGTNYGMSVWNERKDLYTNLSMDKLRKELHGVKALAITTDKKNNTWIGTYDGLLGKYNSEFKLIKTFHPCSSSPDEMQQIMNLYNFNKTNLLIGTIYNDRCLLNFDMEKETVSPFELFYKGSKITTYQFNSIQKNRQNELVALISGEGLFRVNIENNILENKWPEMNKKLKYWLTDFYQDKEGFYWLTSGENGLIRISVDGTVLNSWTTKDGFPTNTLHRIESADDKFLWISTISGLSRFEMASGKVLNFNHRDGLPANEFLEKVSAKTDDGRIVFGSIAGFTIVDPAKVIQDTSGTKIILSDITFQNKSIRSPEGRQFLSVPLEETKEITLPFDKNSFSIYFFSKGKNFLKKNNYSCRLLGLEDNWINLWGTNYATYTNLSPGTYTFEIKSNEEGDYPTLLIIHIQPPWYLTWYAYAGYFSFALTLIGLMLYAYVKQVQLKKEKEMSEYKIQKEHELTEKKLSFFTNISHDLKTPLTLIDAPVNDLLQSKNMDQQQMNKLMVIRRNSRRLYNLITDLLDFRKITEKQYELEVKELRISKIIEGVCLAFKEECKNKSIDFEWSVADDLMGFVDAKKIEKILWNLLSNAIKFTPDERSIFVSAEEKIIDGKKNLRIIVKDEGIGISENDKEKIFNRFFQAGNSRTVAKGGTGIGLSIVKELVELHHGEITVDSKLNSGTTFTITIPSEKENYSQNELSSFESLPSQQIEIAEPVSSQLHVQNASQQQQNLPGILVVEDNAELREYLIEHFKNNYKVYQADNGLGGLALAKEINPDIILTDVQMPSMNGYEFCKEIRLHFETSHIPVVMLTANSTIEQQIEGLNTGADAYLTKPFEIKLLDTVLNTILENRKRLRHKFLGIEPADNLEKTLPKKDIDFIFELKKFIEENIANQDLNVELLSQHFAVSRTPLYQKIKALTGSTPNNLIKSIRLKKAYELLSKEGGRVSEVAYLTGFSDPNYFATCFKKEFGESPSQIGVD